jgi:hypothetical protein
MFRRRQRERKLDVFFSAKKAQDVRRAAVGGVLRSSPSSPSYDDQPTTSQRSFPAIWQETIHRQKNFPPPKTQPFN